MSVPEMRVLRWISEITRWSQLKMGWLLSMKRWGESIEMPSHVQKRAINKPVRTSHLIQVERMKWWRERPKITLLEVVKDDVLIKGAIEWRIRNMWWFITDIKNFGTKALFLLLYDLYLFSFSGSDSLWGMLV